MISGAFYRRAMLQLQASRRAAVTTIPAPTPYQAPDIYRAAINVASSMPVLRAPSSSAGGCGGKCLAHPPAETPAPSMLVATSGQSPTTGIFDVSHLPAPANYPGEFQAPDTAAADSSTVSEKEKGTLIWVLVVVVLFMLLSDPKKGSRKTW
jgi:hypothetical protein